MTPQQLIETDPAMIETINDRALAVFAQFLLNELGVEQAAMQAGDLLERLKAAGMRLVHQPTAAVLDSMSAEYEGQGLMTADLDDLVHDCMSETASAVNNCGMSDQISCLVENHGLDETRRMLNQLVKSKKPN